MILFKNRLKRRSDILFQESKRRMISRPTGMRMATWTHTILRMSRLLMIKRLENSGKEWGIGMILIRTMKASGISMIIKMRSCLSRSESADRQSKYLIYSERKRSGASSTESSASSSSSLEHTGLPFHSTKSYVRPWDSPCGSMQRSTTLRKMK